MKNFLSCFNIFLALPHLLIYRGLKNDAKVFISSDVEEMNKRLKKQLSLYEYLAFHRAYRNLFYYRVGHRKARWLRFFLKEYPFFRISPTVKHIGKNAYVLNHPYCTTINAKYIGDHFTICQLTTLGNKVHGRNDLIPTVGNNVTLGANVNIMGNITIGDNVVIGAGSVVVKDVPNNCVIAGNPAKVIKYIE